MSGRSKRALLAAALLLVTIAAPGSLVRAQGDGTDACLVLGATATSVDPASGGPAACRFGTLPGDTYVPFGRAPVVDEWFVIDDPAGDLRTSGGAPATEAPDAADVRRFLWARGTYTRTLDRTIRAQDRVSSFGTSGGGPRTRVGDEVLFYRVETHAPVPRQAPGRTVLIGIASDPDARPANDWPASSATPFQPWTGNRMITFGGWFSTGAFAAGTTDLGRRGRGGAVQLYNVPGRSPVFLDDGGFTGWVPIRQIGERFRPFTQATETPEGADEAVAIHDLVGRPEDLAMLPVDGIVGAPGSCWSVALGHDVPIGGEERADRALRIRIATPGVLSVPDMDRLPVTIDTRPGGTRTLDDLVAALVRRGGLDLTMPLDGTDPVTIRDVGLSTADWDGDGDVDAFDDAIAHEWEVEAAGLLERSGLGGVEVDGPPGFIAGDPQCGLVTDDPCGLLPQDLATLLGMGTVPLTLSPGVSPDQSIQFCQAAPPGQPPVAGVNLFNGRLAPISVDEVAASLGIAPTCTVERFTMSTGETGWLQRCENPFLGAIFVTISVPQLGIYTWVRLEDADLAFTRTVLETMAEHGLTRLEQLALDEVF